MARADTCTPAPQMSWLVLSPFRMRAGLARLNTATGLPLFLRDALAPVCAAHKQAVLRDHRAIARVGAADPAVLAAIADAYAAQTGVRLAPQAGALALGMQEDFVILHGEPGDTGPELRTHFLSVCFPSNRSPAEKLGLDFTAIHAPVADNTRLQARAHGIVNMALRQTTMPLSALRRAVFFIHVMVVALADMLRVAPGRAAELHAALASMSDAVVAYRGMAAVRVRLLSQRASPSVGCAPSARKVCAGGSSLELVRRNKKACQAAECP